MGCLQLRLIIPVGESHIAQPQLLLLSPLQPTHRKADTIDIKILLIPVKCHPFGTLFLHFGDGEGNLLDHVKAFADYYLHTEEGQQLMKQTARTTEEWEHEQQQMRWVLEEMLPTLQYFCNLEKLETAVLEEQEIEKKVPLLTQGDASRKAYQEAMLAYIRESRIALNTGKELPCMPDIRDFATACPDKSYKEQVMEEIRQEAESYGMTVEAYAANGYEPPKRGGR